MNFKLLRVLASTLVTTLIVGGSLSTLYFINSKAPIDLGDEDDDPSGPTKTPEQLAAENAKAKLGENLASSNLKVKNMDLNVNGLGNTYSNSINLNFKGAIDYKAFIDGEKTNDPTDDIAAKFTGTCEFKYLENVDLETTNTLLNEKFLVNANGNGKLYIDWNWGDNFNNEENYTRYSVSGKIINDVLDFLPTIETLTSTDLSSVTDIVDEIKNIDIIPLIPIVTNALMSFSSDTDLNQTPVEINGEKIYTYNLVLKQSLLESANIHQDLTITLKCNEEGLLRNFIVAPLSIDNVSISLNAETEMSLDEEYVNNSDYTGEYNNLDCTTNLLTTVTSLVNEKAFNTNFSIGFKETVDGLDNASREITGSLKGDLRNATAINNGAIYDIKLGGEKDLYSQFNVRYENNKTYFNVQNGLATGFLADSTIDELVTNIVATFANENQEQTNSSMDALNNILKDSVIYDIMNGNWNSYKKIIKNLIVEGEEGSEKQILDVVINAKALHSSLPDKDFKLFLDLSSGKLNSLGIKDLPVNQYTTTDGKVHVNYATLSLALDTFAETDVSSVYGDLNAYPNFQVVTPLYNSIAKTIKSKQLGVTYGFSYTKASETTPVVNLYGAINADLNNIDAMDFGENPTLEHAVEVVSGANLGLYNLSMHGKVNDVPHNANITYQNKGLYLDYQGYSEASRTRMSLSQGKFYDIFTLVNGLVNNNAGNTELKNPFGEINADFEALLNLTDGQIWTILNSTYLDTLKEYVSITQGSSEGALVVNINNALFDKTSTGAIQVVLDTIDKGEDPSLVAINGSYLTNENGDVFTFSLSFNDYVDPTIDQGEIDTYYKSMDGSVQSIINIIDGLPTSFALNGTLTNPRQ